MLEPLDALMYSTNTTVPLAESRSGPAAQVLGDRLRHLLRRRLDRPAVADRGRRVACRGRVGAGAVAGDVHPQRLLGPLDHQRGSSRPRRARDRASSARVDSLAHRIRHARRCTIGHASGHALHCRRSARRLLDESATAPATTVAFDLDGDFKQARVVLRAALASGICGSPTRARPICPAFPTRAAADRREPVHARAQRPGWPAVPVAYFSSSAPSWGPIPRRSSPPTRARRSCCRR